MGYTHYMEREKVLRQRKFAAAARDCKLVCEHLTKTTGVRIQYEDDDGSPPVFGNDKIHFNGVGEDGHETFLVERTWTPPEWGERPRPNGLIFEFCKTARKPYDAHVCACLVVLRHHLDERLIVSSDGKDDEEGWPVAREACQQLLGYGADFSLLTSGLGRLRAGGLRYRHAKEGDGLFALYVLENDWKVYRRWHVADPRYPYLAVDDGTGREPAATGKNLKAARWAATVEHVRRSLLAYEEEQDPNTLPFFEDAKHEVGNWATLYILADRLDEQGSSKGGVLRALLPFQQTLATAV